MPVDEENRVTKITEASLKRMPSPMAKRLRPALRPELEEEFLDWVEDLRYKPHLSSPILRQMLFEAFVGGWGAKIRQLKKRKKERDEGS